VPFACWALSVSSPPSPFFTCFSFATSLHASYSRFSSCRFKALEIYKALSLRQSGSHGQLFPWWGPKLTAHHYIYICTCVQDTEGATCVMYPCLGLACSRLVRESGHHRPLFTSNNKVPGFATAAMRRESLPPPGRVISPTSRQSDSQGEQFLYSYVEIIYVYSVWYEEMHVY